MRSFANGAATFLDHQHLVVAFYPDLRAEPGQLHRAGGTVQEPLFV